jgi:S1-C subfamily serine protease
VSGPSNHPNEDDFPAGPQPPHERTWRHPSELGSAAHTLRVEQRRDIGTNGRRLLMFSVVAGSILLLGLIVIVQPRTNEPDTSGILELSSDAVEVVQIDSARAEAPMAMVVREQFLLTTVAAVAGADTFRTRDPRSGEEHDAELVGIDPELHLAVLRITDVEASNDGTVPDVVAYFEGLGAIVVDRGGREVALGKVTDDGLVTLVNATAIEVTEGAPVLDQWGGLIGLVTNENSVPCVVLLEAIDSLLAELVGEEAN